VQRQHNAPTRAIRFARPWVLRANTVWAAALEISQINGTGFPEIKQPAQALKRYQNR
jgi:hypothetical protein